MADLWRIPRGIKGMQIAHLGVGVFIIGVTMVKAFSLEKDLRDGTRQRV